MRRKRMFHSPRAVEIFVKAGLIAALAAVLLMPTTVKVSGDELTPRDAHAAPVLKQASWESMPLPPIPHLATMPWLDRGPAAKPMKIDTLLAPKFELFGPAVAADADDARASSHLRRPASTSSLEAPHHG